LDSYLPNKPDSLYNKEEKAVFLHGDITNDHIICNFPLHENDPVIFQPVSIIDYGDSRSGDRIYELMPIHIDVFRCDSQLTMSLMKAYGIENFDQETFSYRAMCYTILHQQDALRSVFKHHPEWIDIQDLKELEKNLWGELKWD